MPGHKEPRLRSVEKYRSPYPVNRFPSDFALNLGKEIVFILATRRTPRLEGSDWEEICVFEFDTVRYDHKRFWWQWNDRNNLEGYAMDTNEHVFTWQPHGSQFTIIETVPENRLAIRVRQPPRVNGERVLEEIGFDDSWVQVVSLK